METDIKHVANKFFQMNNGLESYLEYELVNDSTVVFHHTFVPDELRGRGIAKEIIKEGLEWAISENLEIIATCSAHERYSELNTKYHDYVYNYDKLNLGALKGPVELF